MLPLCFYQLSTPSQITSSKKYHVFINIYLQHLKTEKVLVTVLILISSPYLQLLSQNLILTYHILLIWKILYFCVLLFCSFVLKCKVVLFLLLKVNPIHYFNRLLQMILEIKLTFLTWRKRKWMMILEILFKNWHLKM